MFLVTKYPFFFYGIMVIVCSSFFNGLKSTNLYPKALKSPVALLEKKAWGKQWNSALQASLCPTSGCPVSSTEHHLRTTEVVESTPDKELADLDSNLISIIN